MVSICVALPPLFVALTVKVYVPGESGMLRIVPRELRIEMPEGRFPESKLHVMGAVPVASRVSLYPIPTKPTGREMVVMVGDTTADSITTVNVCVASP
jgi:hypothetical protein